MYRLVFLTLVLISVLTSCSQQQLTNVLSEASKMANLGSGPLSQGQMASGLKEALLKGLNKSVTSLSAKDGFLKNNLLKIPFPEEAKIIKKTLGTLGMNSLVNKTEVSLNRAAEDAASAAKPIFMAAITKLTFSDVMKIVRGNGTEATEYLKKATSGQLTQAFAPKIATSLKKVDATKYWGDLMGQYNRVPLVKKVNPNLNSYVTGLAIKGLFSKIADEEVNIRKNPAARTTELLKRVFGSSGN